MTEYEFDRRSSDHLKSILNKSESDYIDLSILYKRILNYPEVKNSVKKIHYEIFLAEVLFDLVVLFNKVEHKTNAIDLFQKAVCYGIKSMRSHSQYQEKIDKLRES